MKLFVFGHNGLVHILQLRCGYVTIKNLIIKEPAFANAIKNALGDDIKHRHSKYMNNVIEQDHRGIKSRYRSMKGFKDSGCAMIFCTVFEEIRQFLE